VFPLKDNIPTDRFPAVTVTLIVINVLMYFGFQQGGIFGGPDDCNVIEYGAIPYEITHPGEQVGFQECGAPSAPTILTIFTSMFMHGSILHIAGNMLFLWIFGNNIEDSMGRARFVAFYLLGGIAALLLQTAVGTDSRIPTIGASGAVAAVLGGYLLLYPRARVVTVIFIVVLFTIIELPALAVLGLWFVQQVLFGFFDLSSPAGEGGGVAYFAHIGGFVMGMALIRLFATKVKKTPTSKYPVY
jgi:membrane associated rhomboid family serine protease